MYKSEDVYNMDESALFWKISLEGTLATEQTSGGKHDKAQISINLVVNATGTDKVSSWFIGKAANPRCFG